MHRTCTHTHKIAVPKQSASWWPLTTTLHHHHRPLPQLTHWGAHSDAHGDVRLPSLAPRCAGEGETTKALTPRLDGGCKGGKRRGVENNILLHCATGEEQWANDSRATMLDRDESGSWTFSLPHVAGKCSATAPAFLPQSFVMCQQKTKPSQVFSALDVNSNGQVASEMLSANNNSSTT